MMQEKRCSEHFRIMEHCKLICILGVTPVTPFFAKVLRKVLRQKPRNHAGLYISVTPVTPFFNIYTLMRERCNCIFASLQKN